MGEMTRAEEVMEREANIFAVELLMPFEWLVADLHKLGGIDVENDPRIKGLAKRYGVSEQIMTVRIAQMINDKRWRTATRSSTKDDEHG